MRVVIITVFFFIVSSNLINAQDLLRGIIVEAATNSPVEGATVSLPGREAVKSARNGSFTLPCTKNTVLTITHIGYKSQTIVVTGCAETVRIELTTIGQLLNEVEITAIAGRNKSILYQPVSITKLSSTELRRGQGVFLDDAINTNVPGVTMQRRGVLSGQQFNIRGYGNGSGGTGRINSNFDGQGYKVYLNGIPVTDAEGITTMDDIDFGSVGTVEVTKGPAGTLYGLAVAGVVNMNTIQPPKGKTSVAQEVLLGGYGLQRFTTRFQTAGERSSLLLSYGHQRTDGYTQHNSSKKDFLSLAGTFSPDEKQSINYYFGYTNSYDERSGELTIAQYNNKDYSGNIEYIKRNGHSELNSFRAGVGHSYAFSKNVSLQASVFGSGITSNASSAAGWTDKDPVNYGFRAVLSTTVLNKNGFVLSGITGAEGQRQVAQTIGYSMIDPQGSAHAWKLGDPYFVIGSTTAGANGITANKYTMSATSSFFTEWTLQLPHEFSVTAGIGISRMRIDLKDRFYVAANTKPTEFDTSYKNMVSPHFAINKVFSKSVSAYFAYSRGYKAPVSSYFFIPFVTAAPGTTGVINQQLKPENGNQFELGTKGALAGGRASYQLALFRADFSNKMTAVNVLNTAGTSTLYTYVTNGGSQVNQGIEASLRYQLIKSDKGFVSGFTPFVNLAWSDFKYSDYSFRYKGVVLKDSVVNYDGKAVAGVAKFAGSAGFDLETRIGLYANMSWLYKDGFPISSDGLNRTTSYHLLNAKLGFRSKLSAHFDLDVFAGLNNITGTQYPMMVFVNQLPDAYLAAPLKTDFFGGVNLKYNF
ncbi:MAG: TonB-dependent receptor [Bacteroidota bacterium]|nr:TonB-dependent receptor [Bacteroidota bacterium]